MLIKSKTIVSDSLVGSISVSVLNYQCHHHCICTQCQFNLIMAIDILLNVNLSRLFITQFPISIWHIILQLMFDHQFALTCHKLYRHCSICTMCWALHQHSQPKSCQWWKIYSTCETVVKSYGTSLFELYAHWPIQIRILMVTNWTDHKIKLDMTFNDILWFYKMKGERMLHTIFLFCVCYHTKIWQN